MRMSKEKMSFWQVTVFNTLTHRQETFKVTGSKTHRAKDIKRILKEVHPEYQKIKTQKTKKPSVWPPG